MVGRVIFVLSIALLLGAMRSASADRIARGVRWSAQPTLVRRDKEVTLRWTVTARSADQRPHALPCMWFSITEEYAQIENQQLAVGATRIAREPAEAACAPSSPGTLARGHTYRMELPARDNSGVGRGERVRVRVELHAQDDVDLELAAVTLAVGTDGVPTLAPTTSKR